MYDNFNDDLDEDHGLKIEESSWVVGDQLGQEGGAGGPGAQEKNPQGGLGGRGRGDLYLFPASSGIHQESDDSRAHPLKI